MPLLTILGMPPKTSQEDLVNLTKRIQAAVEKVPILGIRADAVSVFYQPDLQKEGLGEELIARIDGLFIKPERTAEVIAELRAAIQDCMLTYACKSVPQCTYVETFVASMVKPEDCTVNRLRTEFCPKCQGRGGWGSDTPCDACGGTGRKSGK